MEAATQSDQHHQNCTLVYFLHNAKPWIVCHMTSLRLVWGYVLHTVRYQTVGLT